VLPEPLGSLRVNSVAAKDSASQLKQSSDEDAGEVNLEFEDGDSPTRRGSRTSGAFR
jgi:hypothetical protein